MTEQKPSQKRYPPEMKERGVRMVEQLRREDPGDQAVIGRVARQLGVGKESLRAWVKQAEIDGGSRPGVTSAEHDELVELRKEVKELRRANDILQAAASFMENARLCADGPGRKSVRAGRVGQGRSGAST
jgi:transposase